MFRGAGAALPRWESDVTTPGQRGFVLEALPGDEEDLLSAVLAELGQSFTVAADMDARGSGVRRRTWLDTFDWRLDHSKPGRAIERLLQIRREIGGRPLLIATEDGSSVFVAESPGQSSSSRRATSTYGSYIPTMKHWCR